MAEDISNDMMAEMPDTDMTVPPIDNIHAPKPELDPPLLPNTPHELLPRPHMPSQTGEHVDTEMAGIAVNVTVLNTYLNAC